MPDDDGPLRSDNVRTGHLKCPACKTQIYLHKIERDADGDEIRTFLCPRCATTRTLRIGSADHVADDKSKSGEPGNTKSRNLGSC